jgi:hypothetical protein
MAAYVSATLNGEPLGGDERVAAMLRNGTLPEDIEAERLRVRASVVKFLEDNKDRPTPEGMMTKKERSKHAIPTWKEFYTERVVRKERTYEEHVAKMGESGTWGSDFEQRALWEMGHKIFIGRGSRREMMIEQQPMAEVAFDATNAVLWHKGTVHYDVWVPGT